MGQHEKPRVRTHGAAIMAFLVPVFIGIMLAAREDLRLGEPRLLPGR